MSKFNEIFVVIQRVCKETGSVAGNDQFRKIAAETGISVDRLHFYLECLQETGVLQYTPENKSIKITEKGTKALRVFP